MIRTRAQWQRERDAAGIKAGLVKGVNIGPMLDAYHKAGAGQTGTGAMLARVKVVTPLLNGLKKYKTALAADKSPKKASLVRVVDEMIRDLEEQIKLGAKLANPVLNVKNYLTKTIADAKAVAASGDAVKYADLWREDVRGVGTGLAKLAQLDPGVKDIHAIWLPYTSGNWDVAGVTQGAATPDVKQAKIKDAAKEILALALKVQSEFKAMKLIN